MPGRRASAAYVQRQQASAKPVAAKAKTVEIIHGDATIYLEPNGEIIVCQNVLRPKLVPVTNADGTHTRFTSQ